MVVMNVPVPLVLIVFGGEAISVAAVVAGWMLRCFSAFDFGNVAAHQSSNSVRGLSGRFRAILIRENSIFQ